MRVNVRVAAIVALIIASRPDGKRHNERHPASRRDGESRRTEGYLRRHSPRVRGRAHPPGERKQTHSWCNFREKIIVCQDRLGTSRRTFSKEGRIHQTTDAFDSCDGCAGHPGVEGHRGIYEAGAKRSSSFRFSAASPGLLLMYGKRVRLPRQAPQTEGKLTPKQLSRSLASHC